VQFLQHAFDAQVAQLDRRQRELNDLQRQVDLARQQLARDRQSLETQQQALNAREQEAARLAADKGFQDSLQLYLSMPSRQVKSIFMTLDDAAIRNYLQAMPPRTAARIIKEFKTPEELQRIQRVLEDIRLADLTDEGP
jgi:multidrug efflux pump subunit AcrA (membrane-fusion protein)